MKIVVVADKTAESEILVKRTSAKLIIVTSMVEAMHFKDADAFILLTNNYNQSDLNHFNSKTVLLNSVNHTLADLKLPDNFLRMNAWATFISRESWEVCGDLERSQTLFDHLGWKFTIVADSPGFVAARVIAMIINEAYYALGENVSTKEEIDIAMKLGTNYPYGPFEWAEKIGLQNIHELLNKLSESNSLYKPAPSMEDALTVLKDSKK